MLHMLVVAELHMYKLQLITSRETACFNIMALKGPGRVAPMTSGRHWRLKSPENGTMLWFLLKPFENG